MPGGYVLTKKVKSILENNCMMLVVINISPEKKDSHSTKQSL